jgi:DNA-binding transcriptional ArsR family regulator
VEQKAIMQGEGKQPSPKDPVLERALSHPKRLSMLGYLMEKRGAGTDKEELAEALDLSSPRVKYHLSVLRGADLIAHIDGRGQDRYIAAAAAGL